MAKYNLILTTNRGDNPRELKIKKVYCEEIPQMGNIIPTDDLEKYIQYVAKEKNCQTYITNFSSSDFKVSKVEHILKMKGKDIVSKITITANKIF